LVDAAWRCAATKRFHDLTIDEVCAAAGVSKGAFYGYFASKQDLLLALLDESAAYLDRIMTDLDAAELSNLERVRRFNRAMLESVADPGRIQVRADLWADILTVDQVRARFAAAIDRRRGYLRGWLDAAIAAGEIDAVPANAVASILLALADGLLLHAGLDAGAFRWANIRHALELVLLGDHLLLPRSEAGAGGNDSDNLRTMAPSNVSSATPGSTS